LRQLRDPDNYPEITSLSKTLENVVILREWSLGLSSKLRKQIQINASSSFMEEDLSNLPMVLNNLEFVEMKPAIMAELSKFYEDLVDYTIKLDSGTAQLYFKEKDLAGMIPATRLSDGILKYLALLCVLLHPSPPPIVCIEEPELGLHPDILPAIGELLIAASERCQLVVTTHSPVLIDSLSNDPEFVLVSEKERGMTTIERLDKKEMAVWLETYTLGELWTI
jgi:predicted ATPase